MNLESMTDLELCKAARCTIFEKYHMVREMDEQIRKEFGRRSVIVEQDMNRLSAQLTELELTIQKLQDTPT